MGFSNRKGIAMAGGFKLQAEVPLDVRNKVDTITERDELVTINAAWEGMHVYVSDTKKTYEYKGNKTWEEVLTGSRYTHPTYTSRAAGLYKVTVDGTGHVSAATAVTKADITALGIPGSNTDTTYTLVTSAEPGLMSSADKVKLDGIAKNANNFTYTHPSYTARTSGLYKIVVDGTGHISDVAAVTKADITALGIPGSNTDTTYNNFKGASSSANGTNGLVPMPYAGNQSQYLRGDGTWATPTNTTYGVATTSKDGLMSTSDKSKLDGIASGANKYTHPTYTSRAAGLYKVTVDGTGHVSAATAVTKADITALGIPAQDTVVTYGVVTASANGLMTSTDKAKLDGIASGANKYVHPTYAEKGLGLYKLQIDVTGHAKSAVAVAKSDITALGIPAQDTTYSTGTASTSGLTKLYTGTGTATDGTMTQNAINTALNNKLSLSGGKLTGKLVKSAGQSVYDTRATAGTAGYVLLCTLGITENYMNEPIEFTITRRSDQSATRISIAFVSVDNKDPGLSVFKVFGGTNDIWMYKSAASTWQLYVHKTEGYDNIGVLEYYHPDYMKGVTVTWGSTQVSAVPSGAVRASWGYIVGSSTNVIDSNNSTATTFAYSKTALGYGDYSWLAGWNGYELRAVDKNQFTAKSTKVTTTITASKWTGSGPYTNTITVSGVTTTNNVEVLVPSTITTAQAEAWMNAGILCGSQAANSITLKAYGDKPSIDIPIECIIRKDI